MANYFIRPDGNDSNTGLGPTAGQAWLTLTKALGATGIKSGDVLYVSPGKHTASFGTAISPNPTVNTRIVGDSNSSFFTDITPGEVRFNHYTVNDNTAGSAVNMLNIGNDFLSFENIVFAGYANQNNAYMVYISGWKNIKFYRCKFYQAFRSSNVRATLTLENYATDALMNLTVDSCIFYGTQISLVPALATVNALDNTNIINNIFISPISNTFAISINAPGSTAFIVGQVIANNHFIGCGTAIQFSTNPATISTLNTTFCYKVINNLFTLCPTTISAIGANRAYTFIEVQNRMIGGARTGSGLLSTNICGDGYPDIDLINSLQLGYDSLCPLAPVRGGVNVATGSSTGSSTDYFGSAWVTNPSIGPLQLNSVNGLTNYVPIQQSPSSITIAPGSTSQSVEVFLGATGLTASTAGLSARYNRTRTASVNIPLVARTIGQAWISGGFAEVDAVNMPGVYRVDIPDAALAAGADDVTLVVRGASGTNGAVMTVKLSSGGLTSAQTASAVWGAAVAGYNTALDFGGVVNETRSVVGSTEGLVQALPQTIWDEPYTTHTGANTFGARVLKTTVDNRLVDVGSSQHIHANVHAIVDSTVAAAELSGALLHNGTDYISADLLSPATPATTLRMGPYSVVADQTKQEINVDILTGASLPVVLQLVDANGTGIPLTGATLSVKIYTTSGTLVATYTGTASYADAGFVTFTLTSAVTATPGTYYVTVTRSSGATDTSIYGGLRLYVRSN